MTGSRGVARAGLSDGELRARQDLRQRLGMKPKVPGKGAIKGSGGDGVWDLLSLWSPSDSGKMKERATDVN